MSDLLDETQRAADLEESRRWGVTAGKEGAPVAWFAEDLTGVDLENAALGGGLLTESVFAGANLRRADISHAQAGGVDFTGADLSDANLAKAMLVEARFDGASAARASFRKADLVGASLAKAELVSANLDGADCSRASFAFADLSGVTLLTTSLVGADLCSASLSGARFDRTLVDASTCFVGCVGLESAVVESIIVGDDKLLGDEARAWLVERT